MNIVVTGSSSGLGLEIAKALFDAGHTVIEYDVSINRSMDVCDPSDKPFKNHDVIDALINCAGVNSNQWFEEVTTEEWQRVQDVNVVGLWRMTQHLLPKLVASPHKGVVINITSNAAWTPMTCSLAYNASKAAAEMVTRQMAHELTPKYGITIFGIAPNKLRGTGMSREIEANVCKTRGWTPEFAAEYQRKSLMKGKETEPAALANYISFLLSDEANFTHLSGCIQQFGK